MQQPVPRPTAISKPFWDALRERRIVVPRCDRCGWWIFYPRRHCPRCCSERLTWTAISGQATLCSYTIARIPTLAGFAQPAPQNLAIVTLAEGFNMNSALAGVEPEAMRIGMELRPVFNVIDHTGATRLLFTAADSCDGDNSRH
ncbi:OB-fold domain-containing protein [Haliea sp. E1-2-M8]|uniref:Zn-ribbon domain-containing OB-fold protein n=1 Tax=Haliea sp. E1-2-M8 TaxID=3064706 RepID=UPI0027291442|nr:OB-fold domain-containing protein [Haliea sp. E1-2-M8]MDO8860094.1 OB-fold domain-containing protein [Haliea sp. E1-2-M8]